MIDGNSLKNVFESYNLSIKNKFEESIQFIKTADDYSKFLEEASDEWEKSRINGRLPSEIFKDIDSNQLETVFKEAAAVCDDFVPRSLADRIEKEGMLKLISAIATGNENIEEKIAAIRMLGYSGSIDYAGILMDLLYSNGEYGDLISETARKSLFAIGRDAIALIEKRIKSIETVSGNDFHLLIALIEIDADRRSETIYKTLRYAFRNTDEKALAARCLSDFGDGRAVALLRTYITRNIENLDEDTIHEIQGAILNLGGSIEDIEQS